MQFWWISPSLQCAPLSIPTRADCPKLKEGKFPRNFGVDTLAGVMGIDPPSFGGKERGHGGSGGFRSSAADEQERKMVMGFLERWKKFDWTSELDGEKPGVHDVGFSV